MSNLSLVSFVGVDEKSSREEDIQKVLDFESPIKTEFSVLFSDTKSLSKDKRYPSYEFCEDFLKSGEAHGKLFSLHLCGDVINRYFAEEDDMIELANLAHRIQLNLNISKFKDYDKLSNNIIKMVSKHGHNIILQENKTKRNFNLSLLKTISSSLYSKINLLHDGSGGFGREITKAEIPSKYHFTGYAGGIKPENVTKIVKLIEDVNVDNTPYYIDMESGIREDNIFSIEKCYKVIDNLQNM